MAPSSPTPSRASASSSYSMALTPAKFASLPITGLRDKIVDKIMQNRVTLIVGETGCGKSSQVPLFLMDEGMTPVLCTQPRRFAVVAVARMVAKTLGCEVGGDVGYHIGHSRVISEGTKIFFKTAGVVLEEMRQKGFHSLRYKVIILDEVHERSVESDLVLVCVKQYMLKNKDARLVLMSATADHTRYRDYFKDLGRGERVEVLAIPSSGQHSIFQQKVLYLDQVVGLLGMNSESSDALSTQYCSGLDPTQAIADVNTEVHKLIHDLVLHIHQNEPDIEKSILVFLPTYYSLEQQWHLLKPFSSTFKVHILHSCIDTVQALAAMKIVKSHRKVILATNIAESSVTIPEVAYVIDSCRSLQVYWDGNRKAESAQLVWVSKSQANQRKGRTGRTCDGQIFRLVTRSFFHKLEEYEFPAILKLSLRLQVLLICCAEAKSINDPKALLQRALDPPEPEVIEDALSLLVNIKAITKSFPRGRYEPTYYGRLLSSFSLSFDASVLILKFGAIGMLREGILLGILMDTQPRPILRPFGQDILFAEYISCYYAQDDEDDILTGRKEAALIGNLCAYEFWQRVFKDKHRIEHLKELLDVNGAKPNELPLPQLEEEWCSFHNLVQSSLNQITEIYDDILSSFHEYRPTFFCMSSALPSYYDPYDYEHTCLFEDPLSEEEVDNEAGEQNDASKCLAKPFVTSHHFQSKTVAQKLADIVKEIRVQLAEDLAGNRHEYAGENSFYSNEEACRFFLRGQCIYGSSCLLSHSIQARPTMCKFFGSLKGCRYGDSCLFSHDLGPSSTLDSKDSLIVPEDDNAELEKLLELFPTTGDGSILLVNDDSLNYSINFSKHYDSSRIICTTSLLETTIFDPSLEGVTIMWGFCDPSQAFFCNKDGVDPIPWNKVKCVLWFPDFGDICDNPDEAKHLVKTFFEYLSILILANGLVGMQVILTMNNIRFSQLQVEKIGRECFFFLGESFRYDEASFGELRDGLTTKKSMVVANSICYVFNLHPPSKLQFGNYASEFNRLLRTQQDAQSTAAVV